MSLDSLGYTLQEPVVLTRPTTDPSTRLWPDVCDLNSGNSMEPKFATGSDLCDGPLYSLDTNRTIPPYNWSVRPPHGLWVVQPTSRPTVTTSSWAPTPVRDPFAVNPIRILPVKRVPLIT